MLTRKPLNQIIFLNVETTSQHAKFEDMPSPAQELFLKRFNFDFKELRASSEIPMWSNTEKKVLVSGESDQMVTEKLYKEKAPLFPEWGKISAISFCVITDTENYHYQDAVISDTDEKKLLEKFLATAVSVRDWKAGKDSKVVCSYNGMGFTYPFLAKRFLINLMPLPPIFDFAEAKPWENEQFISLMDIWKFNQYNSYTSLDTLAHTFGIECINYGEQVGGWFHCGELDKLKAYSKYRTLILAHCYLRMKGITNTLTLKK